MRVLLAAAAIVAVGAAGCGSDVPADPAKLPGEPSVVEQIPESSTVPAVDGVSTTTVAVVESETAPPAPDNSTIPE